MSPSRLSGVDSFFLDIESDECPLNMGLLLIVDKGSDKDLEQKIRDIVADDTALTRTLKRKIQPGDWSLDHPSWIVDTSFNVDNHISWHQLNASATDPALNRLIADIAHARMDRSRPLWEVHIITGLEGGKTAVIGKLHHSIADGATGMLLIQQLMGIYTPRPGRELNSQNETQTKRPPEPQRLGLFTRIFFSFTAYLTLRLFSLNQFLFERKLRDAANAAPHTRFNTLLSNRRSYTHGQFSLAQMRKISASLKCSRNDVFLATLSGALRKYLSEHDELPQRSLYTGLPMLLPKEEQRIGAANQLTFYRSSLATAIASPRKRLEAIQRRHERSASKAKTQWHKRLLERLAMLPPQAARSLIALYIKLVGKGIFRPNVNVISTLLPGPAKATNIAGREVLGIHPISIPFHGAGLFVSAIRYQNELHYGVIADAEQLPDPDHFAALMHESMTELLELAEK